MSVPGRSVLLLAAGLGLAAQLPAWFILKPNRLVNGQGFALHGLDGSLWWLLALVWLAAAASALRPRLLVAAPALAAVTTGLTLYAAASGSRLLSVGQQASARVSLGMGFWLALVACYVGWFAATRLAARRSHVVSAALLAGAFVLYLVISGQLAGLGLVRELAAQGADFKAELGRHLALSGTSLLFGVAIGLPAAVAAHRRPGVATWLLPTVAFFQTVPSLALFGLLLPLLARLGQGLSIGTTLLIGLLLLPLALLGRARTPWLRIPIIVLAALPALLWVTVLATVVSGLLSSFLAGSPVFSGAPTLAAPLGVLGVRGIGAAPALIALILYSLLPIVRNTYEGLQGVPAAAVQAGRGMGMSRRQLLTGVELPLALPVMVAGIRAAAVLVVGITTVAFLIGAGGLGVFIQRGIDQVVPDLVLLGALPVIALALLADGGLRALGTLLTARPLRQEGQSGR